MRFGTSSWLSPFRQGDFFMPFQQNRHLCGYSWPFPSPPTLKRMLSSKISLADICLLPGHWCECYFYFQLCYFKEAQLWELVLLESPVNGSSYRNVPLSSLVMIPVENCFQSSAIQTQTNLLCITTFLFYLLQKLSTWLMTLHSCTPKAQM